MADRQESGSKASQAPVITSQEVHDEDDKDEQETFLVVWDFDWSMINENSDIYPVRRILGDDEYAKQRPKWEAQRRAREAKDGQKMAFAAFQDSIVWKALFEDHSTSRDVFESVLSEIPMFEENLKIVRALGKQENVTQIIVSAANTVLIDIILTARGLKHLFPAERIFTNFGQWQGEDGQQQRLRVESYIKHYQGNVAHGCAKCAAKPGMCKGDILTRDVLSKMRRAPTHIVYTGDGANDFCPATKLRGVQDSVFVRKGKELQEIVERDLKQEGQQGLIRQGVNVAMWADGKELLQGFKGVFGDELGASV